MKITLYDNILIELPDNVQEMTDDEKNYFYPQIESFRKGKTVPYSTVFSSC